MASSLSTSRARVFSAYRRLFRARRILFQNDDTALRQSRVAIRQEFVKNRDVDVSSQREHFEGLLGVVDEAEDMLLHGIVQGKLNDDTGHYGAFL